MSMSMSNLDTEKEKWLEDNEARITELSEVVVGAMEEKTLIEMGMEAAIDIVRRGWANYPHVFESEWKQYQEKGKEGNLLIYR